MLRITFCFLFFFLISALAFGQDTTKPSSSSGHLYGQFFGDYFYKSHADTLNRGRYQYSKLPVNSNAFQIRRIYLGYKYDFSSRFSADILMESTSGNGSMNFSIKYANLEWKNIYPGADLVIGRMKTPTFSTVTDKVWNYRSIERTVADRQGSPSYDLGAALWGHFDAKEKFGYNIMIGNGEGNELTDDRFKKFYGELFARLADKKLVLDLYADYERFAWQRGFHQSALMLKAFAAYQSPRFTIGVEGYTQMRRESVIQHTLNRADTVNAKNLALSVFIHGKIWKDRLGFFARSDYFNPFTNNIYGTTALAGLKTDYDPANRTGFITAGFDFSPLLNIHIMPNIWFTDYRGILVKNDDYDLVYRLTFFYKFEG